MGGGECMSAKSILVIGNVENYVRLIIYALMKGYRILHAEDFKNGWSFTNQEGIKLVIIGKTTTLMDPVKNLSLMNFAKKLEAPLMLTGQNGHGPENIIVEAFQESMPAVSREAGCKEGIDDVVKCFFNGKREEAMKSDCLVFKREKDFISLEVNVNGNRVDVNRKRNNRKTQGRIERAIAFMEEHYDEDISLDQIAHAAYLNPYHFCRSFKKHLGTTSCKYLSALRIGKAKGLLVETELSVTEICFMTGFNNLTHFERVFKGLEGMTPSAYRRS